MSNFKFYDFINFFISCVLIQTKKKLRSYAYYSNGFFSMFITYFVYYSSIFVKHFTINSKFSTAMPDNPRDNQNIYWIYQRTDTMRSHALFVRLYENKSFGDHNFQIFIL